MHFVFEKKKYENFTLLIFSSFLLSTYITFLEGEKEKIKWKYS